MQVGQPVAPTRDDPLVHASSEAVGGPAGWRVRTGSNWWTPMRVALAVVIIVAGLGIMQRGICRENAWASPVAGYAYSHMCYSDIPHMYRLRGFAEGNLPYVDEGNYEALEYPVLTGAIMAVTAELARALSDGGANQVNKEAVRFFDLNAWLMLICAAVAVWATVLLSGRRPWDGVMAAAAPVIALSGTINWDLAAVALLALGMLAWSRYEPGLAGVLIGLAIATKLYPVLVLGPLFLLCLRAGKLREFTQTAVAALLTWLAINVPVMVFGWSGWTRFWVFSEERGPDFGTPWLIISQAGGWLDVQLLNRLVAVSLLLLCAGIAALALFAPRRPRFAQLAFLVVVAFVLTIKVYSPQYALWLVPLAVLARPRWRDFLIWQVCEIVYWAGVWLYLLDTAGGRGLDEQHYWIAISSHLAGTAYLAGMVVRDILRPQYDPVRADGVDDDPSGGPLDGAPDRFGPTLARAGAAH
ncbi:MAG: glycosyltransferase family 87 protein [Actinomycetes bacterium]|nr:glycosyltransferase 87 family protein [Actinomycetes bacterium]